MSIYGEPGFDYLVVPMNLATTEVYLFMSLVRVHNLAVSLDGFGTGADQQSLRRRSGMPVPG